jgi:hypothetical protein
VTSARRPTLACCCLTIFALSACQDGVATASAPAGAASFRRYVAIGTGISMGTMADGITSTSQRYAWPALLAAQAQASFTQPLLATPGCRVPLVAPLALSRLLSGAPVLTGDTTCAGRLPGSLPPFNDVAIDGATAWSAFSLTPADADSSGDRQARQLVPLVLRAGRTQVTEMVARRPALVSVELGAGELLGATSGLVVEAGGYAYLDSGATFVAADTFAAWYDRVIDSVNATRAKALLLGAVNIAHLAALRRGDELFSSTLDSLAFDAWYITLSSDCRTSSANNLVFVPGRVLEAVAEARAASLAGLPRPVLSCADVPGARDFVLTPADTAQLGAAARAMDAHIRQVAAAHGYAYVDADELFTEMDAARPAFNLTDLLTCTLPFGEYVSVDGVHPNGYGQRLIANAAAAALGRAYGFRIPARPVPALTPSDLCS